jgi:hypothetical protein
MTLSTAEDHDLSCDDLETICELADDVYRNQWITFAYHKISERARRYLGDDATWCTFARWSSYTVGKALDLDVRSSRLEQMLDEAHLEARRFPWVHDRLQELNRDLRRLSDSAMPRTLAIGNHFVFHDIAYSMMKFLDWYDEHQGIDREDDDAWDKAWKRFLPRLEPLRPNDLFQDADIRLLRDGLRHYLDAIRDVDGRRSDHILHGNVLLAVYEQWRLDPILRLALDPVAKSLVEFRNKVPRHDDGAEPPQAVLRRGGTRWALRHQSSIRRWIADQYGQYLTQVWLTYEAPLESEAVTPLVVGKGFARRRRRRAAAARTNETVRRELERTHYRRRIVDAYDPSGTPSANGGGNGQAATDARDPGLLRVLSIYDRSRPMRGSASWTRFADRMQFIVDLFREHRSNEHLHQAPKPEELAMLRLELSDAALDKLRQVGDDEAEKVIDRYLKRRDTTDDPRELVEALVRYGWGHHPGGDAAGRKDANEMLESLAGPLPRWADRQQIERGQQFLEDYALPIAAALFNGSLPVSYTAGHGTKVLTATADLASANVNRRLAETGQMLLDLMTITEKPLAPGSPGGDAARGVRLFHAAVRRMLERRGWDPQKPKPRPARAGSAPKKVDGHHGDDRIPPRGRPINQEDLLGTLVAFTVVVLDALDEMGIKVPDEDRNAYIHLWLVVGALLGIDYELIHRKTDPPDDGMDAPPDLAQLRVIGRVVYRRNSAVTPDGQVLAAALMQMLRESFKGWWLFHSVPTTTTRWLLGDEQADFLGLAPAEAPARVFLRVSRPFLRFVSVGRVGAAPAVPVRVNAKLLYQQWISKNTDKRPPWRVPEPLRRTLGYVEGGAPDQREIDLTEPEAEPVEV